MHPSAAPTREPGLDTLVRADEPAYPFERHIESRTVVLADHRILFVAVPKAAWTTLLWLLTGPGGLSAERFAQSAKPEVSPSMAVHDMRIWADAGLLLENIPRDERPDPLHGEGWFRFAVVRDPATRLWSAWQTKLLLREPVYLKDYGAQPWFPRVPSTPDDVIEDFRTFVRALAERGWADDARDTHWAPQHLLANRLPLDHIGRVERLDDTVEALRGHLGGQADLLGAARRENRGLLPYHPGLYDEQASHILTTLFSKDYQQFGYPPPPREHERGCLDLWKRTAAKHLPLLREIIARHERLAALHAAMRVRHEQLRHENTHLQRRLAELTRERDQLRQRVQAVHGSHSWRVTRPLRAVGRVLRSR